MKLIKGSSKIKMHDGLQTIVKRRKFGKRNLSSSVLYYSGFIHLLRCRQRYLPTRRLIILTYHRVVDPKEDVHTDLGVISGTVEDFKKQMAYVKKHYNVISASDLIEAVKNNRPLHQNSLLITFDDGYLDIYLHAFQVLRDFNLPATVFIPTDYIGSNRLFWWDEVALVLRSRGYSYSALRDTLKQIKEMEEGERRNIIEKIENYRSKYQVNAHDKRLVLNWDEIREMAEFNIEFASHTCSHVLMGSADFETVKREIFESKKVIEKRLGRSVEIFCYPRGGAKDFKHEHYGILRHAGFELAVCSIEGINVKNPKSYTLRRISVSLDQTIHAFASRLCGVFL